MTIFPARFSRFHQCHFAAIKIQIHTRVLFAPQKIIGRSSFECGKHGLKCNLSCIIISPRKEKRKLSLSGNQLKTNAAYSLNRVRNIIFPGIFLFFWGTKMLLVFSLQSAFNLAHFHICPNKTGKCSGKRKKKNLGHFFSRFLGTEK